MEGADDFVGQLERERHRLQNAVDHLQQSNKELRQAIEEAGPDRDFKEAIEENIVVIAKYKARIERLDKEITELRRGLQSLHQAEALLTNEGALAAATEQQQAPDTSGGAEQMQTENEHQREDADMPDAAELPLENAGGQQPLQQQGQHPPGQHQEGGMWM